MAICGDIASFSFENSKHLTTGDGGIITTNSDSLALEARSFCNLGSTSVRSGDGRIRDAKDQRSKDKFQNPNYLRCDSLGLNYRMPEVAAAIGLAQLEKVDLYVKKKKDPSNVTGWVSLQLMSPQPPAGEPKCMCDALPAFRFRFGFRFGLRKH